MIGYPPSKPIAESPAMRRALVLVERFAPTPVPILLVGATGTGKEVLARHIHVRSGRAGRFEPVNCGALPREMAESLLFGHRRGAFTGALESRRGYLALADRGTLFLDELLSLPAECQAKLLRALDSGEMRPLGEDSVRVVDARVVAAVQDMLPNALARGDIRQDLLQRVAGVVIELPPLVERPADVLALGRHFATLQGQALGPGADSVLLAYPWPGNARELFHVVQRASKLVDNGTLAAVAIAEAIALGAPTAPSEARDRDGRRTAVGWAAARAELLASCGAHGWKAEQIAHGLGISRATLFRRLQTYGISLQWPHTSHAVSRRLETE